MSVGRRVGTYLVLTFGFSSIFYFLIIRAGNLTGGGGFWIVGLMRSPAAAAFLASLLTVRPLSAIGWRWSWRHAGAAYAIPVLYALVAYGADPVRFRPPDRRHGPAWVIGEFGAALAIAGLAVGAFVAIQMRNWPGRNPVPASSP